MYFRFGNLDSNVQIISKFLFIFILLQITTVDLSGIRTRIFGLEGKNTDQ